MKAPRESDLVRCCLQYLRLRGVLCWRQNSGAVAGEHKGKRRFVRFHTARGCSDIVGILPGGKFLAVEAKLPGRQPTPDQRAFLAAVESQGGLALVVHDLAELATALDAEGC
jgi:hypothetical protein